MVAYEHERTTSIVQRFVLIGNTLRPIVIVVDLILFTALFTLVGSLLWPESWWLATIAGVIAGYGLGVYMAALLTVLFEWMAQLLIAQGEIVAALRERDGTEQRRAHDAAHDAAHGASHGASHGA